MQLRYTLLFIAMLIGFSGYTQTSKKAIKYYNTALIKWSERKPVEACRYMQKAIRYEPEFADFYSQLGRWYMDMQNYPEALNAFRNGYQKAKYGKKRFAAPFARCLLYTGKPDSTLLLIALNPTTTDTAEYRILKDRALFVKNALQQSGFVFPVNMGIRVNTKYAELFPTLSPDMQKLYFTRRINKLDADIFVANVDSCGGWLEADNIGPNINSPNEENATCISADGHYLFFTRCENKSETGWDGGGCDLYMTYRVNTDSNWVFPDPFGATLNTAAYEGMPALSPDNREMYFVSDRPGGYGGTDIWISRFDDGLWQLPVNAGPAINSSGNETSPFIGADNRTLYFSSDGHIGMGGYDLFMSRKKNDTVWEKPVNLGYPINTAYDEVSECVTRDGSTLLFSSDRYAKTGNFDLYQTTIPTGLRPHPVIFIHGYAYDSLSREKLNEANMYITNFRTGDTIYHFETNRGDGSYVMLLESGFTYKVHTARLSYTAVDDTLYLNKEVMPDSVEKNICMLPLDYLAPIHDSLLATIHFDVNKVELTAADKAILRRAIDPWLLEKRFVLHVNGYTDNTGNPMINEELSTRRAKQVMQEIIGMGIEEMNIDAHGWGESKMIAPNDNEEHQRLNRRVEVSLSR